MPRVCAFEQRRPEAEVPEVPRGIYTEISDAALVLEAPLRYLLRAVSNVKEARMRDPMSKAIRAWRFAALAAMLAILSAANAEAAPPAVTDIAAELHARAIGHAYQTSRGLAICVESAKGEWFLWYAAHPNEGETLMSHCVAPARSHGIFPMVRMLPPFGKADTPSFSGATSIEYTADPIQSGWPDDQRGCGPLFPWFLVVTRPDGRRRGFYVIVRIADPWRRDFSRCRWAGGRPATITRQYDDVVTIESVDAGDGTSVLWSHDRTPILLRVRAIPTSAWTSDGNVFIVPYSVLGPQLQAAGWDSLRRNEAVLSVIRSTVSTP